MKDLQKYYKQGLAFLNGYGIKCGNITNVSADTRATHRWGQTRRYNKTNTYRITISDRLLQDNVSDIHLMNTMVHELLHTVDGCMEHRNKWKALADKITATSDLTIKRTTSYEEIGIERPKSKYAIKCVVCGKEYERDRASAIITHCHNYRCTCGGDLERIR